METLKRLIIEEEGQGLVEYGLIIGLVAIAAVVGLTAATTGINDLLKSIGTKLTGLKAT